MCRLGKALLEIVKIVVLGQWELMHSWTFWRESFPSYKILVRAKKHLLVATLPSHAGVKVKVRQTLCRTPIPLPIPRSIVQFLE